MVNQYIITENKNTSDLDSVLDRPITSQVILRVHPLPSVTAIGQFITHTRTNWKQSERGVNRAPKERLLLFKHKNVPFKHRDNDNKWSSFSTKYF